MTVRLDDIRAMSCVAYKSNGKPGVVYFHSQCHESSPTWVRFEPEMDELVITCAECDEEIVRFGLSESKYCFD